MIALIWMFVWVLLGVTAQAMAEDPATMDPASVLHLAPINPAFSPAPPATTLDARNVPRKAALGGASTEHAKGYLPSPINRSHMLGLQPAFAKSTHTQASYPASFDLRSLGRVTPVQDQGSCGDCWSFSTIASAESNALVGGLGSYRFSENHQNVRHGFENAPCVGGNGDIATAYQTRWGNADSLAAGLVYNADDPYTGTAGTSVAGLSLRVHMQEVLFLPDRTNASDNDNYKYALQNYGAIDIALYMDDTAAGGAASDSWNPTTYAYHYDGSPSANHEVALVGWDDHYLATNFSTPPQGNGAFIAKNQWGTSWGDKGYFYISYYDLHLTDAHVFRVPQSIRNYVHAYLYDPFGMTESTGYDTDTAFGANVFKAVSNENLQAVAFYTPTLQTSYAISIYTNLSGTPTTGTLENRTVNTTGSFPYAGYHTVVLSRPVPLVAGQLFAIVVRFNTPNYTLPVPLETRIPGYDGSASASAGHGYLSSDGTHWTDVTSIYPNASLSIRGFTQASTALLPNAPGIGMATAGSLQATVRFTAPTNNGGSAITSYQVTASPGNLTASGSASPITVTGLTNGTTYTFSVTATNTAGRSGASAPSNPVTPFASPMPQTIATVTFSATTLLIGSTATVRATTTSGLPVTFTSTTQSICTVNGGTITGVASGTCTIAANQPGNSQYSAALQVISRITIITKNPQTIGGIGVNPLTPSVGSSATVTATATSGLAVSFSSTTLQTCTLSGNTLHPVAVGLCMIAVNQVGNARYASAPQKIGSVQINPGHQTIGTLRVIPAKLAAQGVATVSATSPSGLPVTFTSTTPRICTTGGTNGSTITGLAAGSCTITAAQAGNAQWMRAPSVSLTFTVTR